MVGVYEVGKWSKNSTLTEKNVKTVNIHVISDGITRLPILEGEISHIEIPKVQSSLGLTIVGGADTPLRCVVVQEVFAEGVVGQDGRLQPGDQIIEVDGADMTSASHTQVCESLKKCEGVLRLGVYRERIDAYRNHPMRQDINGFIGSYNAPSQREIMSIVLYKEKGRQLGIKLGNRPAEPGIFISKILDNSIASQDGRLRPHDRILAINDIDVRFARLELATRLLQQTQCSIHLIVAPGNRLNMGNVNPHDNPYSRACRDRMSVQSGSCCGGSDRNSLCSNPDIGRTPSCESLSDQSHGSSMLSSPGEPQQMTVEDCFNLPSSTSSHSHSPDTTEESEQSQQRLPCECKPPAVKERGIGIGSFWDTVLPPERINNFDNIVDLVLSIRGCPVIDPKPQLQEKNITVTKSSKENLGMRIGGGVSSNEGDTPIYIAYINPQGPVGKSKQVKKGDVVLSVNNNTLFGLTHSQAVALLKTTVELTKVKLVLLDGPDTSTGPSNFVPSWLYWQKLPRSLHISKTVVLHRPPGTSLGFSIVGGSDPTRGPEPIHVLFVVAMSPAAIDGKLRCGDRLLAVDGHSLEAVPHAVAVALLKQAGERVHLDIVSWLGSEL